LKNVIGINMGGIMKLLNGFAIALLLIAYSNFQARAQNNQTGNQAENQDTLSTVPDAVQLTNLFSKIASGQRDPFQSIPFIASRGNNTLPALQSILTGQINQTDSITAQKNSLYAVMVLEAIGTTQAFSAMIQIASQDFDPEVRGAAMNSLANVYNQIAQGKQIITNDTIVMVFALNADDTTQVKSLQMSIGKIACEGIFNWTGLQWQEPMTAAQEAMVDSTAAQISGVLIRGQQRQAAAEAHRQWWEENRNRLQWNPLIGRFDIQ
jgi:hypothetical protein